MARKRRAMRRIGDVAREGGVGVETIRFYEREGLIEQPPKPERGWREYGDKQLLQLGYVKLGQELGLTLRDVRQLSGLAAGARDPFCDAVRETVAARLARLDEEIAALRRKRTGLARWLSQCRARGSEKDCPLYAQLKGLVPPKPSKRKRT